jgi:DinB superfamily
MTTECNRIADALASALSGDAWYGDSLRTILGDVTADHATAHPIPGAHSIWEVVLHVEAWVQFSLAAVRGVPIPAWPGMPKEQDWPPVAKTGEHEWREAVASFVSAHSKLVDVLKALNDDRLEETVPGRAYNFYHLFHGMIQHAAYHGGQIALLRKAVVKCPIC